jgi:hypothetical protein
MLKRVLRHVSHSSYPERDRVMILLSVKAGLRACEIAGLDWSIVLDAQGKVSGTINVWDIIAKKRGGRRLPMHPDLRRALERLAWTVEPVGPIIRSYRGGHLISKSVVNWFVTLFKELGFEGCSSHSGRRSFITVAARNTQRSGCSLGDVQLLAGHRSIETSKRPSATLTGTHARSATRRFHLSPPTPPSLVIVDSNAPMPRRREPRSFFENDPPANPLHEPPSARCAALTRSPIRQSTQPPNSEEINPKRRKPNCTRGRHTLEVELAASSIRTGWRSCRTIKRP